MRTKWKQVIKSNFIMKENKRNINSYGLLFIITAPAYEAK